MVAYMSVWKRLRLTLEMIKFEHSVFALPFALTAALLAWRDSGYPHGELASPLPQRGEARVVAEHPTAIGADHGEAQRIRRRHRLPDNASPDPHPTASAGRLSPGRSTAR